MQWTTKTCIALVDMQAFFPSCEQIDFPELMNKPVAVTNGDAGTCIISSSYEARAYGIKTGMRMQDALILCPELIKRPSRPKRYAEISGNIISALRDITPDIEVFSIDECWMDLYPILDLYKGVENIATMIRKAVYDSSGGINCSIGISEGKLTAKFVAGVNKGVTTIVPANKIKEYMAPYPLEKICGIGDKVLEYLNDRGYRTIGDLQKAPHNVLSTRYGVVGKRIQSVCNGHDPVELVTKEKPPKSIGHSKQLPFIRDKSVIESILIHLIYRLTRRMRLLNIKSKSVGIYLASKQILIKKIYYFNKANNCNYIFIKAVKEHMNLYKGQPLLKIGIKCFEVEYDGNEQFDLFSQPYDSNHLRCDIAMDEINKRFGDGTIRPALEYIVDQLDLVPVIAFNFNATSKAKNSL
ncbi:DNA polymerase Y family protein [Francisella sp. TX07-6608]|uniref:DNA polymerase Y family protein n=1 Tax=Francisella sp. TX07-6608 TaxID=573568 RepID=UPI0008F9AC93|nr:DNA polymerase IV [Francisella sp. TX07-6608]OIN85008.1 impB/mucB/samB family protein [Francisella sp. TX07-6608]